MLNQHSKRELVAIYVRKSRLKDADDMEIDRQLELLTDYAYKSNFEYEIFKEEGSSEDWNRPDFQRMIRAIQTQSFDGVLVTDQDRLSRDRTDYGLFVRILQQGGMLLHTLNKTFNFLNDEDMFMSGMQSEMDNHFMRMTKRKLRRGRIQAIKKGVWFGVAPFGYSKDEKTKKLILHPEESKVVKEIYDLYLNQGHNRTEICERLNQLGYTTREGSKFSVRSVSLYLSNVAYLGIVQYQMEGEELIYKEDSHPALISREDYDKAQQLISRDRIVPQTCQRGVYSLSKLLFCPSCGQSLSFCMKYANKEARRNLDKSERDLYILNCYSSMSKYRKRKWGDKPKCKNNGIKAVRVEEAVFEHLQIKLDSIDIEIDEISQGANTFLESVAVKEKELRDRLDQLENQKKKVQQGFIMEIFSDEETRVKIKEIKEDQLEIEQEIKSLEGANVKSEVDGKKQLKVKIEHLLSVESKSPNKTNRLLSEIIEKVYYWKEESDVGSIKPFEIKIEYNG
ncbi:recombinase family protein [Halobacillus sp. B29]|uniref:recombinase family protein n=1 Tax=Halobacillus sp. B29 TaxID=3457432 RepID=UPI003FCCA8F3